MKKIMKDHKKLLLLSVLMIVFVSACTNYREADGTVSEANQIFLDTPFMDSVAEGWFNVFVWPVAQLINLVAGYSDAGIGIIVVTLLLNFLIASFSIKQQVSMQKMQQLQPEIDSITRKYAGKTDQNSRMRQATEMNALYKKHEINPFGSIIGMFIQLPIIFSVYQAVIRANSVNEGSFLGVNLTQTPIEGVTNWSDESIAVIIIFILMALFQFVSLKMPQYLQKKRKAEMNVKTKDYANPKKSKGMSSSMNSMMYVSWIMIIMFSVSWPLGMSFYWMVSAFARIIQNLVIQKFFIK